VGFDLMADHKLMGAKDERHLKSGEQIKAARIFV